MRPARAWAAGQQPPRPRGCHGERQASPRVTGSAAVALRTAGENGQVWKTETSFLNVQTVRGARETKEGEEQRRPIKDGGRAEQTPGPEAGMGVGGGGRGWSGRSQSPPHPRIHEGLRAQGGCRADRSTRQRPADPGAWVGVQERDKPGRVKHTATKYPPRQLPAGMAATGSPSRLESPTSPSAFLSQQGPGMKPRARGLPEVTRPPGRLLFISSMRIDLFTAIEVRPTHGLASVSGGHPRGPRALWKGVGAVSAGDSAVVRLPKNPYASSSEPFSC